MRNSIAEAYGTLTCAGDNSDYREGQKERQAPGAVRRCHGEGRLCLRNYLQFATIIESGKLCRKVGGTLPTDPLCWLCNAWRCSQAESSHRVENTAAGDVLKVGEERPMC